ncbi:MAG: thermonuclease family protein [Desulfobacterales bacterium]
MYDGDTVLVSASSRSRMVRLVGIDAPERAKSAGEPAQPFSRKSRDYLSQRIKGKKVMIRDWGSDRYGRLLGEVILEGENINLEMIRLGLAEVYRGRPPERFDISAYRSAETKARATGRGIWSLGSRYRSPVDWKHGRK